MSDSEKPVDDEVAVCTECNSDQPDQYILKNPFFHQGSPIPCKFCGGVVVITMKSRRKNTLNQRNRERGLPPVD